VNELAFPASGLRLWINSTWLAQVASTGLLPLPDRSLQIAVLLTLAAGPRTPAASTYKRALLRRVLEIVRERCHEPELDPATVAAALGLSRRYVHVPFAAAGTTFTRELYESRLQRAQCLLGDKRSDGFGVAEIAWNSGFTVLSHFTKRFRERFGLPATACGERNAC
jgi:transcriptional regulator GlxA family with amidase domain